MFKILWHKYTLHRHSSSNFFVEAHAMNNWCVANIGSFGKNWDYTLETDSGRTIIFSRTFRFKRREDYVMFKLANL